MKLDDDFNQRKHVYFIYVLYFWPGSLVVITEPSYEALGLLAMLTPELGQLVSRVRYLLCIIFIHPILIL